MAARSTCRLNFVPYDPIFGALSVERYAGNLSASKIFEVAPTFLENILIPALLMRLHSLPQDVSVTTHLQTVTIPCNTRYRKSK